MEAISNKKLRKAAYDAARYAANRDVRKAQAAAWQAANKERRAATNAAWYETNKDRVANNNARFRAANPFIGRIYAQNRRARQRSAGRVSSNISDKLLLAQKGKCACCKAKLSRAIVHLDHILPIARGGEHCDTNLQLLCKRCNLKKHAKHPVDFMRSQGYLL